MYRHFFKRFFDIIFSLLAILILSPLLLILSILVRIKHGHPVLFKQKRPGLHEKIFTLYKFRTMTNEKDENGNLLPNDKRVTGFGRALRSLSLDELPELFNILKGDMSFIGPRPLLIEYLPLYSDEQKKRHNIVPGLTGLAQVKGRNAISWEQKFQYDLEYLENVSLHFDIYIFLMTVKSVLCRENINETGKVSMSKFSGN